MHLRVHTFTACAVVNLGQLPEKLNPVIKPLMDAVKKEENTLVQNHAALCIAKLLQQCTTRSPSPNSKIIKNLCNSLCVDPHLTPLASCPAQPQSSHENSKGTLKRFSVFRRGQALLWDFLQRFQRLKEKVVKSSLCHKSMVQVKFMQRRFSKNTYLGKKLYLNNSRPTPEAFFPAGNVEICHGWFLKAVFNVQKVLQY